MSPVAEALAILIGAVPFYQFIEGPAAKAVH
jgi:hypothetical protein